MSFVPNYGSDKILDTVVIGGGQAGLAIGYYLARQQRDFVILDAHRRVGDAWRLRWDSLRLFTPAKFDGLPGMPFPGDRLSFPTKEEQAAVAQKMAGHATPLIRTRRVELTAAGVRSLPRLTGASDGRPAFGPDQMQDVANVIWCTGYRDEFGWVDLPAFDQAGRPRQRRGVVESVPGLYFLGLEFLFAAVSATIPGVGRDARYLADHIAARISHATGHRQSTVTGAR